jgi:hypothetical protein
MFVNQESKVLKMSEELKGKTRLRTGLRMYIKNLSIKLVGCFSGIFMVPSYTKPQSFDPERAD